MVSPHRCAAWSSTLASGGSLKQNGCFNMTFTKAKEAMVSLKTSLSMSLKFLPTDTMLLMNQAWDDRFSNMTTNKKEISERGWFPFNCLLLNYPEIRATVTMSYIETEKKLMFCTLVDA